MKNYRIFLLVLILMCLNACVTVKPYEQMYIHDPDMTLSPYPSEKFVHTFQIYREGSAGADGGKSGGGCGCN